MWALKSVKSKLRAYYEQSNTLIGWFKCLLFDAFQSIKWKQDEMFSLNLLLIKHFSCNLIHFSLKFKAPIINGKTVETFCNDCVRNHLFVCYILCSVTYFNQSWCWFCCSGLSKQLIFVHFIWLETPKVRACLTHCHTNRLTLGNQFNRHLKAISHNIYIADEF